MSTNVDPQAIFNAETAAHSGDGPVISDTASGILVGTDSAAQKAPDAQKMTEVKKDPATGRFTEEDLAKARQQEKDKLYGQLESMRETVARLEAERKEREDAEAAARQAAEEEARKKEESELDLRELLEKKEQEWQAQLAKEQAERENAFALLEKERQFQALSAYRTERLEAEKDSIIPELVDLVQGNTQEEIESSINALKERSARILESAQAAMQQARRNMPGARVTSPGVGPLDTYSENNQITPQDISAMSMDEYAQHRAKLIGGNRSARGMFG